MPENPLLPNAQLRALHSLLQLASDRKLPKPRKTKGQLAPGQGGKEALLAGTLVQLGAGDVLITDAADLASELLPQGSAILRCPPETPRLASAAGIAEGLRRTGSDRIALVLLQANTQEAQWADALAWAQEATLPLVIACSDASGSDAFRSHPVPSAAARSGPLSWSALARVAGRLKLPVLSVDGEDPVAVYRVMQESALRARSGGGPAVLWAMLPSLAERTAKRPKSAQPLRRLEHYLATRGISV